MSVEPAVDAERPASATRSFPWPASFVILGAIWGCSFWWIKLGLRAVSPLDVAFARLAAGAVALLVVAALTRTRLPRRTATWGHLFVLAVFLNSAPFTLFAYGETHISAVLAGIINALTPPSPRCSPHSPSFVSNDPTPRSSQDRLHRRHKKARTP